MIGFFDGNFSPLKPAVYSLNSPIFLKLSDGLRDPFSFKNRKNKPLSNPGYTDVRTYQRHHTGPGSRCQ